jgi:hypothetical protein
VRLELLGKLKKIHVIGTRTCDLPACSIVPQPTTILCAPIYAVYRENLVILKNRSLDFDKLTRFQPPEYEIQGSFLCHLCICRYVWKATECAPN